ncbi:unnamed protein product [Sphagnum jensenii]|uniref:Uncharacterized protein n=1 Tax=Sphagnum jensenii TaxID=128206 RepID=A0ABP0XFT9_9BRYO
MSKKKTSRAVMTLKDFHGGSIPSDLPLPSAPGMPVERSPFERQGSGGSWMSPVGRGYSSNERTIGQNRQGLSNSVRALEDKASLFPNPASIGRNYDEDERKPVDGRPRNSVQNQSQVSVPWQAQIPKSKALDLGLSDRASSGGLKPEHSWGGQMDRQVVYRESYESRPSYNDGTRPGFGDGARVGENSGVQGGAAPSMDWERRRSPPLVESRQAFNKERPFPSAEGYRVGYSPAEVSPADASGPRTPLVVPDPVAERPRLKLLPRSKPLETDEAVGHIELEDTAAEATDEGRLSVWGTSTDAEYGGGDSKLAERPKLNLKPRSQQLGAGGATIGSDKVRNSVFGGARPRELVLRARGANDLGTAGQDGLPSPTIGHIPGSGSSKPELQRAGLPNGSDSWADKKQVGTQPYKHQVEEFMESQGQRIKQNWVAPGNDEGDPEWKGRGDFDKQHNIRQYEANRSYDRQSSQNRGPDRQESPLIDRQKTDSWRRPPSPIPATSAAWAASNNPTAPVAISGRDPAPRMSGHHGFSAPASALELVKSFSRSSSIGSTMAGVIQSNSGNRLSNAKSVPRDQHYGSGSINGNSGVYSQKDATFSRLAEATSASPPISKDVYVPGSGFGGNRPYDRFGSTKYARGFGPGAGDINSRLSYG